MGENEQYPRIPGVDLSTNAEPFDVKKAVL